MKLLVVSSYPNQIKLFEIAQIKCLVFPRKLVRVHEKVKNLCYGQEIEINDRN